MISLESMLVILYLILNSFISLLDFFLQTSDVLLQITDDVIQLVRLSLELFDFLFVVIYIFLEASELFKMEMIQELELNK